jgi:hypothetical protein
MDTPLLHHRFISATLAFSGIVAVVIVTNYLGRTWGYRHQSDGGWVGTVASGVTTILG